MIEHRNEHLDAEQLQAFLEGGPEGDRRAEIEEHLAACARCSAELDAWRVLFEDLSELPDHTPSIGFAERVMADFGPSTAAGRRHLPAEVLQDLADGVLAPGRATETSAHLAACDDCAREADAWRLVTGALSSLDRFEPSAHFADAVMQGVGVTTPVSIAARARAAFAGILSTRDPGHLDAGRLQELLDGALSARRVARIRTHLEGCQTCASEAQAWQGLFQRLDELERFAPARDLERPVLQAVRMAGVAQAAPSRMVVAARATARRLVPRSRQAWAALSGMAVTPAVVGALVLYAVFSHPTVTAGSLLSFAWWQVTDFAISGWTALSAAALESGGVLDAIALLDLLASAPMVVAGGVLGYTLASAAALRVLYKQLNLHRSVGGRHVRFLAS